MEDESLLVVGGPPWPLRCCGYSFAATSPEGAGERNTMTNVSAGLLTPWGARRPPDRASAFKGTVAIFFFSTCAR